MQIEIISSQLDHHIIRFEAHDLEEIQRHFNERGREDREPRLIRFAFDTEDRYQREYIVMWLHQQKATKGCNTYGEAVRAVAGTICSISGKYIVRDV